MINRVSAITSHIHDLQIFTIQPFCNQFLSDNILETTLNANFGITTDIEQLTTYILGKEPQ